MKVVSTNIGIAQSVIINNVKQRTGIYKNPTNNPIYFRIGLYSSPILLLNDESLHFRSNLKYLLLPLSISLVEILKEFIFGGFPWSPAAIIYYKNLWILNFLPLTGVYGMGILIHLFIGLIIYLQIVGKKKLSYLFSVFAFIIFKISIII